MNTQTPSSPVASLLGRARYYFDWFKATKHSDHLTAAATFMADYRKNGGTETPSFFAEIEAAVRDHSR